VIRVEEPDLGGPHRGEVPPGTPHRAALACGGSLGVSEPGRRIATVPITPSIAAPVPPAAEPRSPGAVPTAIETRARACLALRSRALRLTQELGVTTTIDPSGWLTTGIELHYRRARGGTIEAVLVRVGHDAPDAAVLADGGVLARCRQYNAAIDQLRQLGLQLAAIVRDGRVELAAGRPVASAHAKLARLDEVIAYRQAARMGLSVVRLDVLVEEIAWFQILGAELAPIVQAAERSTSAAWDRDTEDVALDGGG
jgi:hypothetical protein